MLYKVLPRTLFEDFCPQLDKKWVYTWNVVHNLKKIAQ